MVKKALPVIILLIVLVLGIASQQSDEFFVSRSITIAATPEKVFPLVNTMRSWEEWSPWEGVDPAMKKSFGGPPSGEGSSYSWSGNMEVGSGVSTIVESRPNEHVKFRLEMLTPLAATNDVTFSFVSQDTETVVSWAMSGKKNFVAKLMGLIFDCDKMVGEQFETGLSRLKTLAESQK